jgi:hypothetical protein
VSRRVALVPLLAMGGWLGSAAGAAAQTPAAPSEWRQHDLGRVHPPELAPPPLAPAPAPSDAIVLFNGRDLSAFATSKGDPAQWKVENGYMQVVPGTGFIQTRQAFGDMQLHVEWASPTPPQGEGQGRGDSGITLMGQYEIQVQDSYQRTDTYPDGQAASIYGQYPPLVNATRPSGEWQSYDIYFRRPRFGADGNVLEPARLTLLHNGILVQNNEVIYGPTAPPAPFHYVKHADELPFTLQGQTQPVRFRNIWVRKLPERPAPPADYIPATARLTDAQLNGLAGAYYRVPAPGAPVPAAAPTAAYILTREDDHFLVKIGNAAPIRGIPSSPSQVWLTQRGGMMTFKLDAQGNATDVSVFLDGRASPAVKR